MKIFVNIIITFIVDINALPWLKSTFWSVFLPKTLGRVFQIPRRMFFVRPDDWNVFLDNSFAIQYQNTRSDLSDNLVIN